ncbi:MAG: amidohydrolase [Rhizobiaceae bacterium]|nr:amidohydrolase [Rhizobiaceae bacterium]
MLPLLDTHMHLVYRDQAGYGWTKGIAPLAEGDFTLDNYAEAAADTGIGSTIFMETGVDDADYQAETRFVHGLSRNSANGVAGIVASIRPESDEGFDAWLDETLDLGVAGYRRILHVVADDMSQSDTFRRNVRRIGDAGRSFDMCFLARQLPIALEFAKACDNTQLVLDHCGVPDIAGGGLDPWRSDIAALAELPHVTCKLSGISAYCAPGEASKEAVGPYVDHVLECFGPQRIVWGSDWPVVNLGSGLKRWAETTRAILDTLSAGEAAAIAHRTAERVYGVSLR